MSENQVTSSKDGTTFTTFEFKIPDVHPSAECSRRVTPDERRHNEIKKELRNISSSIEVLCIIMFLIGIVFLLRGCAV